MCSLSQRVCGKCTRRVFANDQLHSCRAEGRSPCRGLSAAMMRFRAPTSIIALMPSCPSFGDLLRSSTSDGVCIRSLFFAPPTCVLFFFASFLSFRLAFCSIHLALYHLVGFPSQSHCPACVDVLFCAVLSGPGTPPVGQLPSGALGHVTQSPALALPCTVPVLSCSPTASVYSPGT